MSRFVAAMGAAAKALIAGNTDIQRKMEASSGSPNQPAILLAPTNTAIPMATDNSTLAVVMVRKWRSSISRTEIKASAAASPGTFSQNPTNTMTMEMSPKALGPRTGAWIANSRSAKICEKTVLVVSQEVGDSRGNTFTRRIGSALDCYVLQLCVEPSRDVREIAVNSAVLSTNRG